jgi:hypothetical protein
MAEDREMPTVAELVRDMLTTSEQMLDAYLASRQPASAGYYLQSATRLLASASLVIDRPETLDPAILALQSEALRIGDRLGEITHCSEKALD